MDLITALTAAGGASAGGAADPNFNQTVLLLHGDGTNGAQNNTFLDSSTNNFTITRNGNTTQGTFSPFSADEGKWSVYPGAQTTYAVTASSSALGFGTGAFTIEFWIYNQGSAGNQWLIDFRTSVSSTNPWLILNSSNELTYGVGSSSLKTTSGTVPTHAWTHVALVKDTGGTVKFYINGTADANTYADSNDFGASQRAAICTFGDAIGGANGVVFSYLSNLRIATSAVYTAGFTPSTSPLSATGAAFLTFTSNRIYDQSSNGIGITTYGGIKVQPFSPFAPSAAYSASVNGGSGYFDGTGDYLSLSSNSAFDCGTGDWTIEGWVYISSRTLNYPLIFGNNDSGFGSGALAITNSNADNAAYNDRFILSAFDVAGFAVPPALVASSTNSLNTWYHLAVVRNGTNLSMYRDGVSVASRTISAGITFDWGLSGVRVGGGNWDGAQSYFHGDISSLRLVKGTAVYTAAFTPPTAPLTAISGTSLLLNFQNAGIFDNTGKNNLETVGNAQIDTTTVKYGTGSMEFDGSGDNIVVPDSPNLNFGTGDFTIECWVYFDALSSNRVIVEKGPGGTGQWQLYWRSTGSSITFYANSTVVLQDPSSGTISTGTWYHIAVARSGSTIKLFIDGSEKDSATLTTSLDNTSKLNLGSQASTNTNYLDGFIDDLRITKGVARYTTTFTPPTAAFPDL